MKVLNTRGKLLALVPLVAIAILSIGNRIGAAGKQDDFGCSGDVGFPPGSAAPRSSPSPALIFPIEKPDIPFARPGVPSQLGDRTDLFTTNFPQAASREVVTCRLWYRREVRNGAVSCDS